MLIFSYLNIGTYTYLLKDNFMYKFPKYILLHLKFDININ